MFTLDDLNALCSDQDVLREWLSDLGFQDKRPASCPKCGGELYAELCVHQGKQHWRCKRKGCYKRIPVQSGQLEGSKLPPQKIAQLLYFWARDTHHIDQLLGLDRKTVADWSSRLRLCVANGTDAAKLTVGVVPASSRLMKQSLAGDRRVFMATKPWSRGIYGVAWTGKLVYSFWKSTTRSRLVTYGKEGLDLPRLMSS